MRISIAVWLFASQAWASTSGISGYSGKGGVTCSSCHAATGAAPTVSITGPSTLIAGTTGTYTFSITGGPGHAGGADISADDGGLNAITSVLRPIGADLSHGAPRNYDDGGTSWPFHFTAPDGPGLVRLYACGNSVNLNGANTGDHSAATVFPVTITQPNHAPTLATPAAASPSPVTGTTAALTVLGAEVDDGGEPSLSYLWTVASDAGTAAFSPNGSNAAKSTTATFTSAGGYVLTATIRDPQGALVRSAVSVQVSQTYSSVRVAPAMTTVPIGSTLQLAATSLDQFAHTMTSGAYAWSTDAGTVSASGLYTPPATVGGPYLVYARSGAHNGHATVSVAAGQPPHIVTAPHAALADPTTVALTVLGADDNLESQLKYTWIATGPAPVVFSPNGNNAAKSSTATLTRAGTYAFHVNVVDTAGLNADAGVSTTVAPAFTSLEVLPATATVHPLDTTPFTARPLDQFERPMTPTGSTAWLASGGGSVDALGTFHAGPSLGGPYEVRATVQGQIAHAFITVSNDGAPFFSAAPTAVPAVVTGRTAQLVATAEDESGEAALTYHWDATGPGPVAFSPNDAHAAGRATATFSQAGTYTLLVTAQNGAAKTALSQLEVVVQGVPDALALTPSFVTLRGGGVQQFTAQAQDQFGAPLPDTGHVEWTALGAGEIDDTGILVSRSSPGSFSVGATALGLHATAGVLIDTQPPQVSVADPKPSGVLKGQAHLAASPSDDFVIAEVRFYVDGEKVGAVDHAPFEILWDTTGTRDGEHALRVEAEDSAGNIGTSATQSIMVWNDPNRPAPGPTMSTAGCAAAPGLSLLSLALALASRRRRFPLSPTSKGALR